MPWKVSGVVEQRLQFLREYATGEWTMTELCRAYEISRPTGYALWQRSSREGAAGLEDRSRAPQRHPNQTPAAIAEQVLELRRAHMRWGGRKLKAYLEWKQPEENWPAASTIGEMLQREGLVVGRKTRRKVPPYTQPFAAAQEPNQPWCADFKGWFRTGDGERIDPLTATDACSRYLLRCQAVEKTDTERVQAIFEAAFREYGMPQAIRTDNGAPFASRAVAGLSRLALWWIKLGIRPERIEAGHPEQNGRHERMHRTMKQETAQPPAANRRAQQRKMDTFREEYNQVRPHEALEMQTPAAVYQPSERTFPERLPEPEYPQSMIVRSVRHHGNFRWKRHDVFLSQVFWGERIGLLPEDDRWFTIYFAEIPVARFDSQKLRVMPLQKSEGFNRANAGEGDPSPAPYPRTPEDQKVSGMCPV